MIMGDAGELIEIRHMATSSCECAVRGLDGACIAIRRPCAGFDGLWRRSVSPAISIVARLRLSEEPEAQHSGSDDESE